MPTTWKSRLSLAMLALVAASLLMEIALRLVPQTVLGYRIEDGSYRMPAEFIRDLEVNSLGFHDVEPSEPRLGAVHILILGDSYVEASSVKVNETVGRQLERYLNTSGPLRYQVVSLGRSGWGQIDQYQALEKYGHQIEPDIVVSVFLGLNDVRNNSAHLSKIQRAHDRQLFQRRPGRTRLRFDEAPWLFVRQSEFNRFLSHRLALLSARAGDLTSRGNLAAIPFDYLIYRTQYDDIWEEGWRETGEILELTRAFAVSLGARYVVISASTPHGVMGKDRGIEMLTRAFPAMAGYEWNLDRTDQYLERICEQHRIPLLLLEPRFREVAERARTPLHWPIDGHWNIEGNRLAGQLIGEFILGQERAQ
jgi:hypothetical protein